MGTLRNQIARSHLPIVGRVHEHRHEASPARRQQQVWRDGVTAVQIMSRGHAELSSDTDRPVAREGDSLQASADIMAADPVVSGVRRTPRAALAGQFVWKTKR